ncbi:hypothetical protein ACIBQ0_22540 [Nocardia nova]|uniref:hypothetical protein n=1 Tax=Nocardia nova TaxID=37330 RepID=UPI00379C3A3B
MPITGLESARLKLKRAHTHLIDLNEQVRAFRRDDPYDFSPEVGRPDPKTREVPFRLVVKKATDVPEDWATVVGDILTNLRAALDHSVYEHIHRVRPGLRYDEVQFPIVDDRAGMANKRKRFSRPVYIVVNDAQPYRAAQPQWHPLAILRDLVNADKHRSVLVTNGATLKFKVDTAPVLEVGHWETNVGAQLEVGTVVSSGSFKLPVLAIPKIEIRPEVEYSEAIVIPRTGGQVKNLTDVMADLHEKVRQVLNDLEAAGVDN